VNFFPMPRLQTRAGESWFCRPRRQAECTFISEPSPCAEHPCQRERRVRAAHRAHQKSTEYADRAVFFALYVDHVTRLIQTSKGPQKKWAG
jgi:hypothetical protein